MDNSRSEEKLLSDILDHLRSVTGDDINLKQVQKKCIEEIVIHRKHLLATLPTGSGKSMIFVGALVAERIRKRESVSILIVPILGLIHGHMNELERFGINAINLQEELGEINVQQIKSNLPTVIVTFPETLFSDKGKALLKDLSDKIKYVIIDEVHVLYFWGDVTGAKDKKDIFRETFTRLRELFVHFEVKPILINLTATLTTRSAGKIMKHLAINRNNTFLIHEQPLGENTHITIAGKSTVFSINILCRYFLSGGTNRIVIFCRRLEDCGLLYQEIKATFGDIIENIMQVFTAETEKSIKERIIRDLQHKDGLIRLIIATSALSMGVNIAGAKFVIQLGMPTSFEEYIQKCGRCGREGEMGYAMIYPWFNKAHPKTDEDFKAFCRSNIKGCLKKHMGEHFPGSVKEDCESCQNCKSNSSQFITALLNCKKGKDNEYENKIQCRQVEPYGKDLFLKALEKLAKRHYLEQSSNLPLGYPVLSKKCMKDIVSQLNYIQSAEDLVDLVESTQIRQEVISLVYDFFRDIAIDNCIYVKSYPKPPTKDNTSDFDDYIVDNNELEGSDSEIYEI